MRDIVLAMQNQGNWALESKEDKSAIFLFCRHLQEYKIRILKKKKKSESEIRKLTGWQKKWKRLEMPERKTIVIFILINWSGLSHV